MKFFIKDLTKTVFPADLVAFTEEILNEKLHFMCSVMFSAILSMSNTGFWVVLLYVFVVYIGIDQMYKFDNKVNQPCTDV